MPKIRISSVGVSALIDDAEDRVAVAKQLARLASFIEEHCAWSPLSEPAARLLRTADVDVVEARSPTPPPASSRRHAAAAAAWWNSRHPVGTPVVVTRDSGREQLTRTRCPAGVSPAGDPIVILEAIAGWYLLDRVRPIVPTQPEVGANNGI